MSTRAASVAAGWLAALLAAVGGACGPAPAPLPPPPVVDASPLTPGVRKQLTMLTAAFRATPTDERANLDLAKALLAYQIYDAAEGYLRRASSLGPRDADPVYLLGWMHAAVGKHEAALEDFDRALGLRAAFPQAMLRRADVLRRMQKLTDAESSYRQILKTYPDQPNARFGLGQTLSSLGRQQEAISVLRDLVVALPHFGAANYALGLAYRSVGDEEQARVHLAAYEADRSWEPQFEDPLVEQVRALDRSHQALLRESRSAREAGNWTHAVALLEEAIAEDPNFLVGHINLITCYAHLGDESKVEEHYRKAFALSPGSAELHNTEGLALKERGKRSEARAQFLAAIESDPRHYTAYENLGLLSFEAGDQTGALRNYETAASIAPSSSRSWIMIGTIHLKQGRADLARQAFLKVVRPGPEAEPSLQSVLQAYAAADDQRGWLTFARLARDEAHGAGMAGLQARLDKVVP